MSDDNDCYDKEKGLVQSIMDCMNPSGESGSEKREDAGED